MTIESLQSEAYADAKAALRACAAAAEQVHAALAQLEHARTALRRANAALAEANRLEGLRRSAPQLPENRPLH